VEAGKKLAAQGLITTDGNFASATEALMSQAAAIRSETQHALDEIDAKHAFERA
ncbi:MAG: hypothetical protein JWN45_2496, partial [Acidobacteriaceae bacterium]|nr:hypothetical protein [Acidobacteriaceae bacterium]